MYAVIIPNFPLYCAERSTFTSCIQPEPLLYNPLKSLNITGDYCLIIPYLTQKNGHGMIDPNEGPKPIV